jgi:hypothetical protein
VALGQVEAGHGCDLGFHGVAVELQPRVVAEAEARLHEGVYGQRVGAAGVRRVARGGIRQLVELDDVLLVVELGEEPGRALADGVADLRVG